jgi:ribonucleotide reductase alpha subunit
MFELKEKIILLEKLKNNEYEKLQELKKDFIEKEEKYTEEKIKINNKKLKLKQEQEKWDCIKKKFEADKKLYFVFKQEIENNIREVEDIPELFKNIYPIFEKLDNDKYLNTIQEINKYVELTNN